MHARSSTAGVLEETNLWPPITFETDGLHQGIADEIRSRLESIILSNISNQEIVRPDVLARYSTRNMTRRLVFAFEQALGV